MRAKERTHVRDVTLLRTSPRPKRRRGLSVPGDPGTRRLGREWVLSQASVCAGPARCSRAPAHPSQDALPGAQWGPCLTGEETGLRAAKGSAPGHAAGGWSAARSDSPRGSHSSGPSQALGAQPWEQMWVGSLVRRACWSSADSSGRSVCPSLANQLSRLRYIHLMENRGLF